MADAGPPGSAPLPVWLVTGFRRAIRARLIEAMLDARPADQAWAVAASGLPLAMQAHPAVAMHALPAGCPCCAGTTPFEVGMTRLLRALRDAPVGRLIVEIAEAPHLARVRERLGRPPWNGRLRVEAAIAVLAADDLASAAPHAPEACAALAASADLVAVAPPAGPHAHAFARAHGNARVLAEWRQAASLPGDMAAARAS